MWAQTDRSRRTRGFTLLELLVVIAIMAALTAAFPLALNRFVPARRADAAAGELLADLRLARARGVAASAAVDIVPRGNGYDVRVGRAPHESVVASRTWRLSTVLELQTPGDEARPLGRFRMFPDGSSTGGRFVIRDGERVRSVTVSELTSRVRVDKS